MKKVILAFFLTYLVQINYAQTQDKTLCGNDGRIQYFLKGEYHILLENYYNQPATMIIDASYYQKNSSRSMINRRFAFQCSQLGSVVQTQNEDIFDIENFFVDDVASFHINYSVLSFDFSVLFDAKIGKESASAENFKGIRCTLSVESKYSFSNFSIQLKECRHNKFTFRNSELLNISGSEAELILHQSEMLRRTSPF